MYNFTLNVCYIVTRIYTERKSQCISNSFKFFYLLFLLYGTRTFFLVCFSLSFLYFHVTKIILTAKKNIWKKELSIHTRTTTRTVPIKKKEIITLRHCKISYVVRKRNTHTNYRMRNIHIYIILVNSIDCKVWFSSKKYKQIVFPPIYAFPYQILICVDDTT